MLVFNLVQYYIMTCILGKVLLLNGAECNFNIFEGDQILEVIEFILW